MRRPAVFLERDGILNAWTAAGGPPLSPRDLSVFRHVPPFLRALGERGYLVIVVTSQPALAHGTLTRVQLDQVHRRLRAEVGAGGGRIDGIYHCAHDPGAADLPGAVPELARRCRCRPPAPGLLLEAAQVHRVDLPRSFLVCRTADDVRAGRAAAVETLLLREAGHAADLPADARPDHVVRSLEQVIAILDAAREVLS